jgi:hypothetical protein
VRSTCSGRPSSDAIVIALVGRIPAASAHSGHVTTPRLRRSNGWVFACFVVLLAVVTSCGRPASVGPPGVMVPRDQRDLIGTWFDAQGRPLPDGRNASNGILVIQAGSGSTSCSTDDVTVFMELAWPAGRRLDWNKSYVPGDTHRYVRETTGSLMATDGQSDLYTVLPAAAKDSGIQKDGNAIFTITSKPQAIWIRRGDGNVERWARLGFGEGCA